MRARSGLYGHQRQSCRLSLSLWHHTVRQVAPVLHSLIAERLVVWLYEGKQEIIRMQTISG